MPSARPHHPGQAVQRLGDITSIDGVGQVPRGYVTTRTQERLYVVRREFGSSAKHGGQGLQQRHHCRAIFPKSA